MAGNPFSIEPANPLQALMSGVQGYDKGQQAAKQAQTDAGRQAAMQALQTGGDLRSPLAQLIGIGDVQGAQAIAQYAHQQATEKQAGAQLTESSRHNQATEGFQQQQLAATLEGSKIPPGFQQGANGALVPRQGGPADPAYIKTASEAKTGGGLLDTDTISQMAEQYRAGDTSVLTNLGRGAQGAENIKALRQEIVRQNTAGGTTGADQAIRNAEYFGTKSGQRTLGTKQANIELAATEFNQVLPIVAEASKAVSRTNYPDLNRIIQAFETKTGDPNIVKFGGGINTLVNVYARAISPQGVGTVSDKEHAREILSKAWSQGQFDAAVGMMKQEIDAALTSPEKVRDEMRKRFIGGTGQQPKEAPPAAPTGPISGQPGGVVDWKTYFGSGQ